MTLFSFDELTVAKIAFQVGYHSVFYDEDGKGETIATPDNWLTDSCAINDFAHNTGLLLKETDEGTLYTFESSEEKEEFFNLYNKEITNAQKSVNDLLAEHFKPPIFKA